MSESTELWVLPCSSIFFLLVLAGIPEFTSRVTVIISIGCTGVQRGGGQRMGNTLLIAHLVTQIKVEQFICRGKITFFFFSSP